MDGSHMISLDDADQGVRRPRIALMGEFSAGKSTLSNMLIGASPLPVQVTATQMPPVWISYGDDAPYREDLDGSLHPIDLENLSETPLDETRVVRIFLKSDILEVCDIIDMPGISDPNMGSEVWERVIHHADGVMWCTHATQAWRQSEAAVWEHLSPGLAHRSFLLLTRIDKILNEKDRMRIYRRIEREVEGLFAACYPVSLLQAIEAGEDRDKWQASGAEDLIQGLVDLVSDLAEDLESPAREVFAAHAQPAPVSSYAAPESLPDPEGEPSLEQEEVYPTVAAPAEAADKINVERSLPIDAPSDDANGVSEAVPEGVQANDAELSKREASDVAPIPVAAADDQPPIAKPQAALDGKVLPRRVKAKSTNVERPPRDDGRHPLH